MSMGWNTDQDYKDAFIIWGIVFSLLLSYFDDVSPLFLILKGLYSVVAIF